MTDWLNLVVWPECSACHKRGFVKTAASDWPVECEKCKKQRAAAVRIAKARAKKDAEVG